MKVRSTPGSRESESPGIRDLVDQAKLAEREGRWSDAAVAYEILVRDPLANEQTRLSALRWLGRVYLEQGNRGAAMDVLEAAVAAARITPPSAMAPRRRARIEARSPFADWRIIPCPHYPSGGRF